MLPFLHEAIQVLCKNIRIDNVIVLINNIISDISIELHATSMYYFECDFLNYKM